MKMAKCNDIEYRCKISPISSLNPQLSALRSTFGNPYQLQLSEQPMNELVIQQKKQICVHGLTGEMYWRRGLFIISRL